MATLRKFPCISLLVVSCFYLQVYNETVSATDTLFQGQNMTASGLLTSSLNAFELGFFSLGSTNMYLGIRMKNVPTKDIVWIANRDLPFSGSSMILTINEDGYLVIVNGRTSYRVSDDPLSSQNVSATLLDSGNLVLRDGNMDIPWQSFDYPSNTFLPGMKLGYNNKTGKVWSLTSWLDEEDPNNGEFELKMDPKKSNGVFLMKGTETLWNSGAWTGKGFTLIPEMRLNYIFNYTMYSDENQTYFSYSLYNSSIITRFIIDIDGHMREFVWLESSQQWGLFWSQPRQFCDILNSCGPFSCCNEDTGSCQCLPGFYPSEKQQGQDGGCMRSMPLTCGNGDNKDGFLMMDDVSYPLSSTRQINSSYPFPSGPQVLTNYDVRTCEEVCLSNCSCSAYACNTSGHCLIWSGDILDLQQLSAKDPNGGTIFIKLAASEIDNDKGANWYLWIIAIPVVLFVLLPSSYIVSRWRKSFKNKGDREDPSQDILLFDMEMSITTSSSDFSGSENSRKRKRKDSPFPLFSFDSVSLATDNFSSENKLGEGGFGPVYKGKLLNGQEIAVKRLSKRSGQGLEELKNETMLIAKLQHRNLVRLLGCCLEQGEKILIYEFMPNKSLDSFLFGSDNQGLLDWGTRVRIIEGIAQGLLYLHQYSRLRIIHRDLKASNILLDGEMNPKILDFGLARMFGGDKLQANTNRIVGTYGYMSPEYAMEGLFSIKSDVFSFSVLLLEIVSGKKSTGFYHSSFLNVIGHAWELWKGDRVFELMDPKLEDQVSYPMVYRYINVALLCVQEMAADRPTMSEVVSMLTNELTVLNSPKKPAFSNARSTTNSSNQPEKFSVNDVTVSLMEPR
ncbi:G-type lectin S-receptor-like serine/threonine-protein kinase At4g27290 [Gossypium arboreum]|uniref:G-type lectin S-receptor-like serine/threonine-protein kinase At4g27290 n=1 Tax=Gossypium arboreum TaxID=29729 RepID=UPI0008195AAB|nr:G-type lectin S-receptor-like serine/threonine-protein kinase At4g27290 [Gossypium arboreum]